MGDTITVMHGRRWRWMQAALVSSWPLLGVPGASDPRLAGAVFDPQKYGSGFRGALPSGPVVVSNNVATNLGTGTNEDEVYTVAQSECHLWEDPNAPLLIRAEQTKAATLGILLVVYSYFAYTFTRRGAVQQKIGGTGLVTPAFA